MVDEFKSDQAFEKRKSQNLTFWDYAKDKMLWQYLPIAAAAIGFTIGRMRGGKGIKPLDGSPMITYQLQEKLLQKGSSKILNEEVELEEEKLIAITRFFRGENKTNRLRLEHDLWNIFKGVEFSSIPLIYHVWRNKEAKKLDLEEASNRLQVLSDIKPTDDELRTENASLKQQLDFVQRQSGEEPTKQVDSMSHSGKIQEKKEPAVSGSVSIH